MTSRPAMSTPASVDDLQGEVLHDGGQWDATQGLQPPDHLRGVHGPRVGGGWASAGWRRGQVDAARLRQPGCRQRAPTRANREGCRHDPARGPAAQPRALGPGQRPVLRRRRLGALRRTEVVWGLFATSESRWASRGRGGPGRRGARMRHRGRLSLAGADAAPDGGDRRSPAPSPPQRAVAQAEHGWGSRSSRPTRSTCPWPKGARCDQRARRRGGANLTRGRAA